MNTSNFEICTTHVQQYARTGALLVDVRERLDAQALAFDAPEVVNLPFGEIETSWQALPQDRELVIVCQNGEKSLMASHFLRRQGFLKVSPMRGGILLWMKKGYPVIGKRFTALTDFSNPASSTKAIDKDQAS